MATAIARTNIALVKYWGKRDAALNLPAAGSLSLTLDGLTTRTSVDVDPQLRESELTLNGVREEGSALERVVAFLRLAGVTGPARVVSENNFPTGSGLASSASAFAALAVAATHAAGRALPPAEMSALARLGSGSAARSIFGGFVEMLPEGHATPLLAMADWDVRMVIAVVGGGAPKAVSSRSGMEHTTSTSPLYPAWLATVPEDLAAARAAIAARDLQRLGEVAERSALGMHATALAARPALVYWQGATVDAIHAVRALKASGLAAWLTIDAGPHVKVLTTAADEESVAAAMTSVPGVTSVLRARPGAGAELLP